MNNWLIVDKVGLAKLVASRPKAFVLYELLQNAWDQNVTQVDVTAQMVAGSHKHAVIAIEDDDPNGFNDLRDAYTLFAESRKKTNAQQRGRFNIGEKLVLALAKSARLETTKGTVEFTEKGTRLVSNCCRASGSWFEVVMPLTKSEVEEIIRSAQHLIAPVRIATTINGVQLERPKAVTSFEAALPTVVASGDGVMKPTVRKTVVNVYEPKLGEKASLYEMGIPVVETGDRFHVDVQQKVPLNMDRDNVTPSYLQAIRVAVLNATHHLITDSDASQTWVREACGDKRVDPKALKTAVTLRFGENAVAFDPTDPEANKRSQAEGRPVVYGRSLTGAEWQNIKQAGLIPPAGKVTPSPKPYSPNGTPLKLLPENRWTSGMRGVAAYTKRIAHELLGQEVCVDIASEVAWPYGATYGNGHLTFNLGRLGHRFFDQGISNELNSLLIHEFAHHYESDHLSQKYYDALADLGSQLVRLALNQPEIFK